MKLIRHRSGTQWWVLIVLCLAIVVTAALAFVPNDRRTDRYEVIVADIPAIIEGAGRLEGVDQRWIAAPVSGEIVELNVNGGDIVSRGDTLVRLKNHELRQKLAKAKDQAIETKNRLRQVRNELNAKVFEAEAELGLARERLTIQREKVEALSALQNSGAISSLRMLEERSTTRTLEVERRIAEQRFQQAQAEKQNALDLHRRRVKWAHGRLRDAERRASAATILAEAHSQVVKRGNGLQKGVFVEEGTGLLQLVTPQRFRARVAVPASEVDGLSVGAEAEVEVGDQKYDAFVARIGAESMNQQVDMVLDVPGSIANGRVNAFAEAAIKRTVKKGQSAIRDPGSELQPHSTITAAVASDGAEPLPQEVTFGIAGNQLLEVVSGAQPGDVVYVNQSD